MDLLRAYKFRIYPDVKRKKEIDEKIILAQQFYNALLEKSLSAYKKNKAKVSLSKFNRYEDEIIDQDKKYLKLYSQTRDEIKFRLLKAYQNFFRRCKQGAKKKGFPKFRSRDRYKSITYPQNNGAFNIEKGRLHLAFFSGRIPIENYRERIGKIKTLTIKREAGEYYAIFTTEKEVKTEEPKEIKAIGIDFGIHNFIATSDGEKIPKPQFMRKAQKKIALWQRRMEKRTIRDKNKRITGKQSERREKAKVHLQKAYEKSTRQNEDDMHKLTNNLTEKSGYNTFIVENLQIQNMMRNHKLARSIANCAWGGFGRFMEYKTEAKGFHFIPIDFDNTTQECSSCGHIKTGKEKLTLKDRIYECHVCGLILDRDVNAARVILKRGLSTFGQKGSNAQGNAVNIMPIVGIANSIKELRTDKIPPMQKGEMST